MTPATPGNDLIPEDASSDQDLSISIKHLSPAYFGIVMATGIVSIAAHLLNLPRIGKALFYLNIFIYGLLWILTIIRVIRYPRLFFGDMFDHLQGPGFFTLPAGSCVLGSQFVVLTDNIQAGLVLWFLGVGLWIILTYAIFTAFTIKKRKPSLAHGINGSWLLAVVAIQSIAVLGTLIAARVGQPHELELNFIALSMWLWGGMLYIWMMSLIFYRYTFFRFPPGDLSPPYWINMGAMAISALAGSLLIINAPDEPYLESLMPFLKGFTIFYWATGTWWIPMLLILGIWRHIFRRFPLKYDSLYWGAVFPLGMYSACTHEMRRAMRFDFLGFLPHFFLYAALVAWLVLFIGLIINLVKHLRMRRT